MSESIVIVGAKRTPIGSMQGKFNSVSASQLGSVAIKGALEQAGVKGTEVDDLIFGCVLSAGQGQAPGAPGRARRGPGQVHARHHHQQDVRLGDEGRDDGRRRARVRQRHDRGRRRHGIDDQRAPPAAEGARRLSLRPPEGARPHGLRRPGECLRRQAHGHLRRRDGRQVRFHARADGRVLEDFHRARAGGRRSRAPSRTRSPR